MRDFLHLCREGLATFLREVRRFSFYFCIKSLAHALQVSRIDKNKRQPDARAGSMVDADINDLDVPEKIRSALQKEALFIALATGAAAARAAAPPKPDRGRQTRGRK